jgi:hypothetical protein
LEFALKTPPARVLYPVYACLYSLLQAFASGVPILFFLSPANVIKKICGINFG